MVVTVEDASIGGTHNEHAEQQHAKSWGDKYAYRRLSPTFRADRRMTPETQNPPFGRVAGDW